MYADADGPAIFSHDRKSRSLSGIAPRSVRADIFAGACISRQKRVRKNEDQEDIQKEPRRERRIEGEMKRRGICCGRKSAGGES